MLGKHVVTIGYTITYSSSDYNLTTFLLMRQQKKITSRFFLALIIFISIPSVAFPQAHKKNGPVATSSIFDQLQENVWYLPTDDNMAKLYITSIGRGDTVLTLHGGPGNDFHYLIDAIKENSNHNTFILFDQRGSLLSPVSESDIEKLSLNMLVEDLEILRKSLNKEKIVLLGHSFGTLLALSYYIKYPQHVEGLILSATMPPYINEKRPFEVILKEIQARNKSLRIRSNVEMILKEEGLDGAIEDLTPQERSIRFKITGLASFNMIDLKNWRKFKGGGVYYNRNVDTAIGSTIPATYDIRPILNEHPIPITIIQGNMDYIDPAARYWKDIIQSYDFIHLKVIENASHYSWLDNQDQFNTYLRQAILRTEN